MNYRSIDYLNKLIRDNISIIPRDIDLVVGVPRSGMLPATIIALLLNKPLKTLPELSNSTETSFTTRHLEATNGTRKILVVDDSCMTGGSILKAKEFMNTIVEPETEVIYCCIFTAGEAAKYLDLYFEVCEPPRAFEWNIMNHSCLVATCMDLDGVLCVDPTDEQNDDGPNYVEFLKTAKPLFPAPKYEIGAIVTSRLEKYRKETEQWLKDNSIPYSSLIMLDVPDKETRQRLGLHAVFKAQIYNKLNALLFIESDDNQARYIANYTNKPVYCTGSNKYYDSDKSFERYERIFATGKEIEKKAYDALGLMYEFRQNIPVIIQSVSESESEKFVRGYCDSLKKIFEEVNWFISPNQSISDWIEQYIDSIIGSIDKKIELPEIVLEFDLLELEYLIDTAIYEVIISAARRVSIGAWREEHNKVKHELTDELINKDISDLEGFENEIAFLKKHGELVLYPYDFIYKYDENKIIVTYDSNKKLNYVDHNGKNLYFPPMEMEQIRQEYNQLIMEQDKESPHTYFSEKCNFEDGDIFIDVGAAEGIISLDVVERAKEIYLFEYSEDWVKALQETFAPYKDKVHIIPKYAGRSDTDISTTLDTVLQGYVNEKIFIKMDVEGMELDILKSSVNTLLNNECKLSCTTYHVHEAEEELGMFFDSIGYEHKPSDRYMLFYFGKLTLDNGKYEHIKKPYFRRALIRAWKPET